MNLFLRLIKLLKPIISLMIGSVPLMAFQGDLDIYIQKAKENNTVIKRSYNLWKSAEARIVSVKGLPNPTVSLGYFLESVNTATGPQQYKIGLMQKFPFKKRIKVNRYCILQLSWLNVPQILKKTWVFFSRDFELLPWQSYYSYWNFTHQI